jgi:hypothetical protein
MTTMTVPVASRPNPAASRPSAGTTGPERGNGAERPRARLNKLVRLGVMAEMLLAEVCRVPRDQAALWRLRDAQEAGRRELGDGLLHAVPRSWAG